MIEFAPFLHAVEVGTLEAVRRYLATAGVADGDYAIVPQGGAVPNATVTIVYRPAEGRGYAQARLWFPLGGGRGEVDLVLHEGGRFLCMLLAHGWAERSAALDPDMPRDAILETLGLDRWRYWRVDVRATQAGEHLARDGDGYAYYFVDDHGEIAVHARSATLAAVAVRLAADREAERIDLSGTLGRLRPSDAEVAALSK